MSTEAPLEQEAKLFKQLKRMERTILDSYLLKQHEIKNLCKLYSKLETSERRKFFKLFPTIKQGNLMTAIQLLQRSEQKKERAAQKAVDPKS
jgi:hypothetical protein